jgi:hypothetical protein
MGLVLLISIGIWWVVEKALDKQRPGRSADRWPS